MSLLAYWSAHQNECLLMLTWLTSDHRKKSNPTQWWPNSLMHIYIYIWYTYITNAQSLNELNADSYHGSPYHNIISKPHTILQSVSFWTLCLRCARLRPKLPFSWEINTHCCCWGWQFLVTLTCSYQSSHEFNSLRPGGRLNKKDGLTRYGNSHVKDKTS